MPDCPVCGDYQPRTLVQPFTCDTCGTELKIAGSTLAVVFLTIVPIVIVGILLKPWIGTGGLVAFGIIAANSIPWVSFFLFYRLEPTGTALDLGRDASETKESKERPK